MTHGFEGHTERTYSRPESAQDGTFLFSSFSQGGFPGGFPSREDLLKIADAFSTGIIVVNLDGVIEYANPIACSLLWREREDLIGEVLGLPVMTNSPSELMVRRTDKSLGIAEITSSEIDLDDRKVILIMINEVTEKKKLEAELLLARKIESVGTLAGGIAHDFNNFLTGVLGNITLAVSKLPGDHPVIRFLNSAVEATVRAKGLTEQLLSLSKGGTPVKELLRLDDLIVSACQFASSGSSASLMINIDKSLWPVEADSGQISQVLHNLILNAVQAMPTGGSIEVEAHNVVMDEQTYLPLQTGRYVMISVKDAGIGIPEKYLELIFDPCFSTKEKGSGLGLSTAFSIVKKHNGHLSVSSIQGEGATFTVHLPAADPVKHVMPAPVSEALPKGSGRVLVMDDDILIRDTATEILAGSGYDVITVSDGKAAIEAFTKAREDGAPYALVMLDLTIRGGMGGAETMKHILNIDPKARVVVMSGFSNEFILADYAKFGFCHALKKPFTYSELVRTVANCLSK